MSEASNNPNANEHGENFVHHFKIDVAKDAMSVKLYPLQVAVGGFTKVDEILKACEKEGIKVEIDIKLIEQTLLDPNPYDVIIAKGELPESGSDGSIEYKLDMSAKPQFIADPETSSSMDYKNSMQITLVAVGDCLAEIVPPTKGKPGHNVRGEPIESQPGIPAKYFLGEGTEEKDNKILVTKAGTPCMQDEVVMVRNNYILQGDVDLSTGNITFPGTVVIHGNVTDGFEVISEENVVVNGLVSNAKVKAKGCVKCAGGIQGQKSEVVAGSFVAAMFISAATIFSEGDVMVTKGVLHSNINCLGDLKIGGSLIGGTTNALKGIECSNLGVEHGVKTTVNIRTHYRQEKAKELANSVLVDVNTIFEHYRGWVKLESMPEEDIKSLLRDITLLQGLISKRQMFDARVAKFDQLVHENKNAKVRVLGTLEADTTVASPFSKYNCTSAIKGPLSVTENNSAGKMAVVRNV